MASLRDGLLARIHDRWRPAAAILGAIVVLDVAAWYGMVRGMVRTSGDSEAILSKEQARIDAIRSEVAGLERITSKLACTRSDVKKVFEDTLSSKSERMTDIQRELRDLARARHMDPDAITYSASALRDSGLVKFQISFPLEGPYETLRDFIRAVEASKNFLIVEDISLDEGVGTTLHLNIKLVTYFQAPEEQAAAEGPQKSGRT